MLEGKIRESIGSAPARRLRRDGYLTANIYANGVENIQAAFKRGDFVKAVRRKENLAFPIKSRRQRAKCCYPRIHYTQ